MSSLSYCEKHNFHFVFCECSHCVEEQKKADHEATLTEAANRLEAQQWQPIETADRKTPILGWVGGESTVLYPTIATNGHGITAKVWGDSEGRIYSPTHWQPLPQPPKE